MKREYLGDSYDAVNRLWQQILSNSAPLYTEPRFIPADLHSDFTRLTGTPILTEQRPPVFSILNDPDTGVRLPDAKNQSVTQTHTSTAAILDQIHREKPICIITFDQSHNRHLDCKHDEQRRAKMRALTEGGAFSFYYVSHAPFLFAFPSRIALENIRELILNAGIPEERIEACDQSV